jgi:hypothetical protein
VRSRYCIVCKINITYQQSIYQSKFKHNLVLTSCFFVLLLRHFFTNRFFYCIIFPTRVYAAIVQIIHASTLITAAILYICNTEFAYWYCQSMIDITSLCLFLLVSIFSLPSGFVRSQLCYDMFFFFVLKIWYCQEITFLSKLS